MRTSAARSRYAVFARWPLKSIVPHPARNSLEYRSRAFAVMSGVIPSHQRGISAHCHGEFGIEVGRRISLAKLHEADRNSVVHNAIPHGRLPLGIEILTVRISVCLDV